MPSTSLERTEFHVPIHMGSLIGNTLRQFAMRGTQTWQVAAYKLGGKEGSFGLGGGCDFSYLELLSGRLISKNEDATVTEKVCKFDLVNGIYQHGDMQILDLGKLNVPSMEACLIYASGSRTVEQNYAVVKRLCPEDADSFVTVSSRHAVAITFRFEVIPYTQQEEILLVDATPGTAVMAKNVAVKSLSGLHI